MGRLANVHPGDVLREDFLIPMGMTAYRLAKGLHMSQTAVSEILNGKRAITATTAMRLERYLGSSARFWLGLQADYDLEEVQRSLESDPKLSEDLASIERCELIDWSDEIPQREEAVQTA